MKIGLEFEGPIVSYATGEICRWSSIPEDVRRRIKKMIYLRRDQEEPCDGYDALAEVRTPPIPNPTPEVLIEALFTQMEIASHAFAANGYDIHWYEQNIPDSLHNEIQLSLLNPPPGQYKIKKYTQVLTKDGAVEYKSINNRYRGGGLHINISSLPEIFAPSVVAGLDKCLRSFKIGCKFQSHYRNNILFRTRYPMDCKGSTNYNEPIVEYMAHGFNVISLKDWRKDLEIVSNKTWYGKGRNINHMIWAWDVCCFMSDFFKAVGKLT